MNSFFQNSYESENDRKLDRKFSYNYQVIKNMYPKASELPEEEVRGIIRKYYQAPQGQEEQAIKNYINQKEPEWQQLYGLDYEGKEENQNQDSNSFWQPLQNNDFWGGYGNKQNTSSSTMQPMTEQERQRAKTLASQIRPEIPNIYTDYLAQYYPIIENTGKILYENLPLYPLGYSLGMLLQAKKDMDKANLINGDNYYHRLGMAQIGQQANNIPGLYPAGKFWGYAKEGFDITKKVLEGQPFLEILKDSQKDLHNNDESLNWGLNNPNTSVRMWLKDLDINTNTWKKQNE